MTRCCSLGFLVLLLQVVAIFLVKAETDYCDKSLCGEVAKHIGCNFTGEFLDSCPKGSELVTLTDNLKDLIVDAHNIYRDQVARGATRLSAACRMATTRWNDELAKLAEYHVKHCINAQDPCHNTNEFRNSGQNVASLSNRGSPDIILTLHTVIDIWYSESQNTTMRIIDKITAEDMINVSHFTTIVDEKNTDIGCAVMTWMNGNYHDYIVTCNYATVNIINAPVYKACPSGATECVTGLNPKYAGLCSIDEKYDINKWF